MSLACCRDEVNASKRRSSTKLALNGGLGSHVYQRIILPYSVENLTMHCIHAHLRLRPDTSSIQQVAVDLVDPGAVYPARGSVLFLTICLKLWAVSLVKHQRRPSSQRKASHKPTSQCRERRYTSPQHAINSVVTVPVLLGRGAAFPAGPRTFRGGQRGFKGGPLTLTLHPPDFRSLRGQRCSGARLFWT